MSLKSKEATWKLEESILFQRMHGWKKNKRTPTKILMARPPNPLTLPTFVFLYYYLVNAWNINYYLVAYFFKRCVYIKILYTHTSIKATTTTPSSQLYITFKMESHITKFH